MLGTNTSHHQWVKWGLTQACVALGVAFLREFALSVWFQGHGRMQPALHLFLNMHHYSWTCHTKLYLGDLYNCQTCPRGLLNSVRQKGEAASRGSLRMAVVADVIKHHFTGFCVFYSRARHLAEGAQGRFDSCMCKDLLNLVILKSFT